MLSNAYLLAKIGADTAENEQRFAEILPTAPPGRRPPASRRRSAGTPRSRAPAASRPPAAPGPSPRT